MGLVTFFLGLLLELVKALRLEIIYLPWLLCSLFGASENFTKVILGVSCVAWLVAIIKAVINHFR